MALKTARSLAPAVMILLITALACNLPSKTATPIPIIPVQQEIGVTQGTTTEEPIATAAAVTETPPITHVMKPADNPPEGQVIIDVVSKDTAPERRAPYGDSYDINRLERPFLQDMTYVPDLDIETYTVAADDGWWYVSIDLVGSDPNNSLGIDYGVELDKDHDGFGDFIVWGSPPFTTTWDTLPVKIYQDTNHDSAGLTGAKSDAPIDTDGYDTLVFDGAAGGADPDIAWVRINAGSQATIQFAFKESWSGAVFMLGVVADGGMKNVQKFDLVDRFKEEEAGSPVRDKKYYPLKSLFAVDNACREAFGFKATGEEAQLCPREEVAPPKKPKSTEQAGCTNPAAYATKGACEAAGCRWYTTGPFSTVYNAYCTYP